MNDLMKLVAVTSPALLLFGSVLGFESNFASAKANYDAIQGKTIEDTSFRNYLEEGRKEYGNNTGTDLMVLWTFPGAKLGAVLHNHEADKYSKLRNQQNI